MWKIAIDPRFLKRVEKGKTPPLTIIKKVAEKIEYKPKQKYDQRYNEIIDYGGSPYFIVYEFHRDEVKFIIQVRIKR